MQEIAYRLIKDEFGERQRRQRRPVAPRAWYYGSLKSEQSFLTLSRGDKTYDTKAAMGMTPDEAEISGLESDNGESYSRRRLVRLQERQTRRGDADPYSMILPAAVAARLGIRPEDAGRATVDFAGRALHGRSHCSRQLLKGYQGPRQ